MEYQLYKSGAEWRWRLKAGNGEIIAHGESYKNRDDCINAVNLVMDTDRNTPFNEIK